MADDKPDFALINRLTVSIASHRVQLGKCESVDEMDKIHQSIYNMEQEIIAERRKELKTLQAKKDDLLQKMAALEASLDEVNREINVRVSRYRAAVSSRISRLELEVNGKKSELDPPTIDPCET